jgi:hypothetical protein
MATTTKTAAIPFSPRAAQRVRRLRPRMMLVNERATQQPIPGARGDLSPSLFVADSFNFPRPNDALFDVAIRIREIAPGTAGNPNIVTQNIFTQEDLLKGGYISALGYEYNNPHGFFQVRTTILINGAPPSNYRFRTVDSQTGAFDGSFPTVQIGSVREPTWVRLFLPPNGLVQVRASNFSQDEAFTLIVRFQGWSFGN